MLAVVSNKKKSIGPLEQSHVEQAETSQEPTTTAKEQEADEPWAVTRDPLPLSLYSIPQEDLKSEYSLSLKGNLSLFTLPLTMIQMAQETL